MLLTAAPLSGFVGLELGLSASAASYSGICGTNLNWSLDTETGELSITGSGAMNYYYYEYRYEIGIESDAPWYRYISYIKTIAIGNNVTSISSGAFFRCYNLTSVMIPNSVTRIGNDAFLYCSNLKNVNYTGSKVQWNSIDIGYSNSYLLNAAIHFDYGTQPHDFTSEVTEPATCLASGVMTYTCSCGSTYTETISAIDYGHSDSDDDGICDVCNLSVNVTFIERGTCGENVSWALGDDGTLVISGEGPMYGYGIEAGYAFKNSNKIKTVIIESGVTSIGRSVFARCENLASITIPNSVITIDRYAFEGCTKLTSVTIPDSVTSLDNYAFYNCSSLKSITVDPSNTHYSSDEYGVLFNKAATELIVYPVARSQESYVIPDGVTNISDRAFYNCYKTLTSITIPDSVTRIGYSAFEGCYSLKDVYYTGSRDQWLTIDFGSNNNYLFSATIHYDHGTHVHEYTAEETKPATCTSSGIMTYTCSCGDSYTAEISALGHDYNTSWTIDKAATCLATGIKSHHCKRCDEKTDETEIEKTDHTASNWIIDKMASCINEGSRHKECIYCNETLSTEAIATTAHNSSNWITDRNPDCNNPGMRHTECTVCGEYLQTSAPAAIGHTFHTVVKVAACTVDGSVIRTCTACGKVETEVIPAFEHNYVKKITAPTCTLDGYTTHTCSICGDYYTDTVVKATGHREVIDKAIAATCTKAGKTQGSHCSSCGTVFTAQTTVKAKGHAFSAWKTTKAATYTEAGIQTRTCSACGATETKSIAKLKTTAISKCSSSVTDSVTYTGKALTPTVTVKDGKTTLKKGTHYTVKYTNNKKIGTATVTITGVEKNGYSGTKKLTFNIIPAKTTLKATAGSKKASLSWEKVTGATGYEVYMATSKNGTYKKVTTIKKAATVKYTAKKLTKGQTYFFKVRAYKTVDGKKIYSAYSSVAKVKVK